MSEEQNAKEKLSEEAVYQFLKSLNEKTRKDNKINAKIVVERLTEVKAYLQFSDSSTRYLAKIISNHFRIPKEIVWPEKLGKDPEALEHIRAMIHGYNQAIDACKAAVEAVGIKEK